MVSRSSAGRPVAGGDEQCLLLLHRNPPSPPQRERPGRKNPGVAVGIEGYSTVAGRHGRFPCVGSPHARAPSDADGLRTAVGSALLVDRAAERWHHLRTGPARRAARLIGNGANAGFAVRAADLDVIGRAATEIVIGTTRPGLPLADAALVRPAAARWSTRLVAGLALPIGADVVVGTRALPRTARAPRHTEALAVADLACWTRTLRAIRRAAAHAFALPSVRVTAGHTSWTTLPSAHHARIRAGDVRALLGLVTGLILLTTKTIA